ncbi:hypothetical protein Slin15195_G004020 [Septoria linicola]|uniref:Uncharacterized protein n=1 Tax=Septoria linicola TaxID=215465 RepID=A0A9Q9AJ22_9PEZI|nr:hypothetical protein Slin14017_G004050 [Septoria linicola]USW47083.1 hypothetical protein Slin15195_G004020 [Septoria linicola]
MTFSRLFSWLPLEQRWKNRIHWIQIALILSAIVLSIGRLTIKSPPPSRANVLSITMGIKSLIVIAYQYLTEHKARFKKWASSKANAILNSMEVVFWLTVVIVTGGLVGRETGAATALSTSILLLALTLCLISAWVAVISIKIHRQGGTQLNDKTCVYPG